MNARRAMALLAAACLLAAAGPDAVVWGPNASAAESTAGAEGGGPHDHDHPTEGGEADEHATAGDPNPLAVDLDLAIWTGVVFACLLWVLGKFAWPQIAAALDQREQRIADNIAAAEQQHEQAKQLLVEHEAKLAGAADEVRGMLEEARRDAESTKEQIVAEARSAADQERQRAVREVEIATDTALKSLAETSANMAVELAGKVVRDTISADKQAELVRDALANLTASTPSKN